MQSTVYTLRLDCLCLHEASYCSVNLQTRFQLASDNLLLEYYMRFHTTGDFDNPEICKEFAMRFFVTDLFYLFRRTYLQIPRVKSATVSDFRRCTERKSLKEEIMQLKARVRECQESVHFYSSVNGGRPAIFYFPYVPNA
ncbi:hypothetical protein J6590_087835 [Homalodisca vitripennis]|nr:hypothetical protein J6590_087835 [Homalodisca vitripennis]